MPKNKIKYHAFLDTALDLFIGFSLFNAFAAFKGFNFESLLLLFATLVMVDYWWSTRTFHQLPKHYLSDFYLITIVMFVFFIWPSHIDNPITFLQIASGFFLLDAFFAFVAIFAHKERHDEDELRFYAISEIILCIYYFLLSMSALPLDWPLIGAIFIPYLVWFFYQIKKGYVPTKFVEVN